MSRLLFVLALLVLVLTTVIIFRGAKDSYELLPGNLKKPLVVKPFEEWKEFKSEHKRFNVQFPVLPQHATESIPVPNTGEIRKYDMYVSEKNNGSIFMVSLITYPKGDDLTMNEIIMDTVIKEMLSANSANNLKSQKDLVFLNYHARDFTIENPTAIIETREFMIGSTLYMLSYIAKKEFYDKAEFQYFIDSFEIPLKS